MKITCGDLVRILRKKLNLSQEAFAERIFLSTRQLSRIETNQVNVSILDLLDMMKKLDMETEDLKQLYMDSTDYSWYKVYSDACSYLGTKNWNAFHESITKLEESPLWESPYIQQLVAHGKMTELESKRSIDGDDVFNENDVKMLYEIISITIKDFDEKKVSEYLLTYYDLNALVLYCKALSCIGQHERSISIAKSLVNNKTVKAMRHNDGMFIAVTANLTDIYMRAEMHTKALDNAIEIFRHCIKKQILHNMDFLNYRIARVYKALEEEEPMFLPYILRAYYWAVLLQDDGGITFYKRKAKEDYGITLE